MENAEGSVTLAPAALDAAEGKFFSNIVRMFGLMIRIEELDDERRNLGINATSEETAEFTRRELLLKNEVEKCENIDKETSKVLGLEDEV